jgi:hypothetical protein
MVQRDDMGRVAMWPAFGLATGLFLGSALHAAHAGTKDPIVMDDAAKPHDLIHMTVGEILVEYDQALNRYGPSEGLKFEELLRSYLLGIETGLYVENSLRVHEDGETGIFCLTSLMTGAQLVDFLKERVRSNPKFADGRYQISLARALKAAFPCPGS